MGLTCLSLMFLLCPVEFVSVNTNGKKSLTTVLSKDRRVYSGAKYESEQPGVVSPRTMF